MNQHPPMHHPKNPILGFHGWDETIPQQSLYLVSSFSFFGPFFSHGFFFPPSHFFPRSFFSFFLFFVIILEPKFFSWNSYLLLQPTYPTTHLHSYPSLEPQRAFGACGELVEFMELAELTELVELGEVVELMESLWSLKSLWSLGRETSSGALAFNFFFFSSF